MENMSNGPLKQVSFEADIKPLFRIFDITSMKREKGFDLSKYDDVKPRAQKILERLEKGDMPCDNPWPPERIAKFRDWIKDGTVP